MAKASITERVTGGSLRVDREAGVIRGVRILGTVSRNRRRYLPEAIRKAKSLYEGAKVYFDHPSRERIGTVRAIEEQAGWLQSVTVASDGGLTGDFHYFKTDPKCAKIAEAAERRPEQFGFSHNIEGVTEHRSGETIVTEIEVVHSVDLVTDPATTNSLFEGRAADGLPRNGEDLARWLRETSDPLGGASLGGTSNAKAIRADCEQKILAIVRSKDAVPEKLSKIEPILRRQDAALAGVDDDGTVVPKTESRKRAPKRALPTNGQDLAAYLREADDPLDNPSSGKSMRAKAEELILDIVRSTETVKTKLGQIERVLTSQDERLGNGDAGTALESRHRFGADGLPRNGKDLARWLRY